MNWQRIKALAKKDLLAVIRQPASLFLVFIFPLLLTLAFGFAFGAIGSGGDVQYTVAVVDNDASSWSGWFQGNITNTGVLTSAIYEDQDSAYSDLQTGAVSAVLVIPDGFGASIEGFLFDPDSGSWCVSTLELALDRGSMLVGSIVPSFIQQSLTTTFYGEAALSPPSPVEIGSPTLVDSVKLTQFDHMVPGMFSYSAIFVALIVSQTVTEERTSGILDRIATTPTTVNELFSSVILSNLIMGVAQVLILLGAASLMGFRTQAGVAEILVGMIAALLLVVTNIGFGLLTASISKSSNAATGIAFIFILPQMFLGSFVPAPESASRLVPSYYATQTLTNLLLRGAGVGSSVVLINLLVLAVFSFTVAGLGIIVFSRYGKR